ncbi:MAG: DUF2793 domain-containing protein [Alphaproteobacteria bacterium]
MSASANLALPFIEGGELLPDVTLNETLRLIDTLVQLAIVDRDLNVPPGSPAEGQRWIVKASPSPTGAWAGHGNHVAAWQDGGWVFCVPQVGWFAYVIDEGGLVAWNGSAWVSALAMLSILQNLTLLGVGTTADATNPFSAKLNNALWVAKTVAEGGDGDLRCKLSKESAAKTLSLLFQDNFSGRAEIGLTGDDDFHFKVSADGSSWLDAITIDRTTAKLTANQGFADAPATRAQLYAAPFDALAFNGLQVNGAMELSQENGTSSVTLTATGSLQARYLVDGVMAAFRGTFVAAGQQVTDAPAGYRNSLKFTVSTAQGSLGANDELSVLIPIEGTRAARLALGNANAASISFGFWVKARRAGAYSGSLRNSAKNRSYPFSFTVNAADTWEFKTVTFGGDTGSTWLTDTGVGLYLNICIAGGSSRAGAASAWAGSDYSGVTGTTNAVAATSDTFQIAGLIVLPGIELPSSARAPFIMRPFDQELLLCQRYWRSAGAGGMSGSAESSTTVGVTGFVAPTMRAAPSLVLISGATVKFRAGGGIDATASGPALANAATQVDGFWTQITGFSGLTVGTPITSRGDGSDFLSLNARL